MNDELEEHIPTHAQKSANLQNIWMHWLVRKLLYTTSIEHFGRVEPSIVLGLCYTNIGEMRAYDLYLCILLEDDHRSWLKVRPWSVANIYDWLTHPVECYFEMAPGELLERTNSSFRTTKRKLVCLPTYHAILTSSCHMILTWLPYEISWCEHSEASSSIDRKWLSRFSNHRLVAIL